MKKVTTVCLSTFILGSLGIASQAFAEDGGSYTSNGIVELTPSEEPTNPVNSTDPTNPADLIDPTDSESPNPGINGSLSIDHASGPDFGVWKVISKDRTYSAAVQKYRTVGATGETKRGPNYIQVTGNRGTGVGWPLKMKQEGRFKSTSGEELTGAVTTFKNGNVVTTSDSGKPAGPATITLSSDSSQSDVMSAAKGNGVGTHLFDWGTDITTAARSIESTIPGSTTKCVEEYATKLTWALTDAPGD